MAKPNLAPKGVQPFFRYYGAPDSSVEILLSCLTGGPRKWNFDTNRLEAQLADFLGIEAALCLPQARLGLYVALSRYLTPSKRKVIMSPYTIFDVVNMVIAAGGEPVFADIDEVSGNIDFDAVLRLVDDNTGAIIVTHLHGLACDMSGFVSLCQKNGIPLLEDCAQAFGGVFEGKRLGSIGDAGVFSFSVKKHVNSLYGGCLVVKDPEVRSECREFLAALPEEARLKLIKRALMSLLSDLANSQLVFQKITFPLLRRRVNHGNESSMGAVAYEHNPVRVASVPKHYLRRMTRQQAFVVSWQLPDVDRQIRVRIGYAREYHDILGNLSGIRLPPLREDGSHVYLSFAVQVPDRLRFQRELMRRGCDVRLQSYINLAASSCYAELRRDCPNAEKVAARTVLLPIHTGVGFREIRRIAAGIKDVIS